MADAKGGGNGIGQPRLLVPLRCGRVSVGRHLRLAIRSGLRHLHRKWVPTRRIFQRPSCPGHATGSARCKKEIPGCTKNPSAPCISDIFVAWQHYYYPKPRRGAPVAIRVSVSVGGGGGPAETRPSSGRGKISTTRPIRSYASVLLISMRATSPGP